MYRTYVIARVIKAIGNNVSRIAITGNEFYTLDKFQYVSLDAISKVLPEFKTEIYSDVLIISWGDYK